MNECQSLPVSCPWCFETIEILLEDDSQPGDWVEDCSVCCHPLALSLRIGPDGGFALDIDRSH